MVFNQMIRSAGNRSRMLPDIGQGQMQQSPTANTPPSPAPSPPQVGTGSLSPAGAMSAPTAPTPLSPMQAPRVQPSTFTMHPPGTPADPHQYNYEPQPDGSWRVYPPGVAAPQHTVSASLPRAASTGDYIRMSNAFRSAAPAGAGGGVMSAPAPPTQNPF